MNRHKAKNAKQRDVSFDWFLEMVCYAGFALISASLLGYLACIQYGKYLNFLRIHRA